MIVQKSSALDKLYHQIKTSRNSSQSKMKTMNPSNLFQSEDHWWLVFKIHVYFNKHNVYKHTEAQITKKLSTF